jgi:hypothetical protein
LRGDYCGYAAPLFDGELIGAETRQSLGGFGRRETSGCVRTELANGFVGVEAVPARCSR